jgi:ribosomal protein L32
VPLFSGIIDPKFITIKEKGAFVAMGKPKKQTSPRKTGLRRSHLVLKLARVVNGKSPVKVRTTKRETGKLAK